MDNNESNLVKGFVKQIEQLKRENEQLKIDFAEKQHWSNEVSRIFVEPLMEYAKQGSTKSSFKIGSSIVEETIRRAKAFDTIKELLK